MESRTPAEIPGTLIFDSRLSRIGLPLNNMAMALNSADERAAFLADPEAFMARFELSAEQRQAVRDRDFTAMLSMAK